MRESGKETGRIGWKEGEWDERGERGNRVEGVRGGRKESGNEGSKEKWEEGEWEERGRIGWKEGQGHIHK